MFRSPSRKIIKIKDVSTYYFHTYIRYGCRTNNNLLNLSYTNNCTKCYYSTATPKKNTTELHTHDTSDLYELRYNIQHLIKDFASRPATSPLHKTWYAYLMQFQNKLCATNNESTSKILTQADLYSLALQTINLLLVYTCRRLVKISKLPYMTVINPKVEETNKLYLTTLQDFLNVVSQLLPSSFTPTVAATSSFGHTNANIYDNALCKVLNKFIDEHYTNDNLVILSVGLQQAVEHKWLTSEKMTEFLNEHLRDRIIMKMLATHCLELFKQQYSSPGTRKNNGMVGIIHPHLQISKLIRQVHEYVCDLCFVKYDQTVPLLIKCGENVKFPCIPTDLEYIMQEVLKNSCRAQIENGNPTTPIEISIIANGDDCSDGSSSSLQIIVRDHGGGIPPLVEAKIMAYSFTTAMRNGITNDTSNPRANFNVQNRSSSSYNNKKNLSNANTNNDINPKSDNMMPGEQINNISGMGFGLPLCKAYLELYDGELGLESLYGWGTDVYIKLESP
ncbi:uncharacterized protein SCODWIG_01653 [Saccharomycodes ludwigii]|uniref:Protein-serine/threonine kinase n=1 Tax=Saccharomycodes ludwigii TaxID=36035 RepID=A0A376B5J2_9ASCO|nr:uncharacterized protein SCODWIG_01653 [Saccharomycodes ludwigii]